MSELQNIDKQYVANTYKRFPIEIVSGKGSSVYDDAGKRYIDMGSGIAVTSFGIADDAWVAAVADISVSSQSGSRQGQQQNKRCRKSHQTLHTVPPYSAGQPSTSQGKSAGLFSL